MWGLGLVPVVPVPAPAAAPESTTTPDSDTTWSLALETVGMRWADRRLCCRTVSSCASRGALLAELTTLTAPLEELSEAARWSALVLEAEVALRPRAGGLVRATTLPDPRSRRLDSPRRGARWGRGWFSWSLLSEDGGGAAATGA